MMLDDDVTIQDKADVLYRRVEALAVNGEITDEQFVILDEAMSLWVEYRQALAQREYEEWLRREVEEGSRVQDDAEWERILREEESLTLDAMEDFSYQTEYNREERV
jgi:hypothetical protein